MNSKKFMLMNARTSTRMVKNLGSLISSFSAIMLVSISIIIFGANEGYQHFQLKHHGKTIMGTVVSKSDHHAVSYQFIDPAGRQMFWFTQVTDDAYERAQEGNLISITYLPANPTISEVTYGARHIWVMHIIGGVILSGFTVSGGHAIRKALKSRHLITGGKLVPAQVLAVERETPRMVYTFCDERGLRITDKLVISHADVHFWERNLDRQVAVYYNPSNPKDNLVAEEGAWTYPQLIKRTQPLSGVGRWMPIMYYLALSIWIGMTLWFSHFVAIHNLPTYLVYFAYPVIFIPLLASLLPGIDFIVTFAEQTKALSGNKTTPKNICVDLSPQPSQSQFPHRLSYQYTDQNGVTYDGFMRLNTAKVWNRRLNNGHLKVHIYYDPAKPSSHLLKVENWRQSVKKAVQA